MSKSSGKGWKTCTFVLDFMAIMDSGLVRKCLPQWLLQSDIIEGRPGPPKYPKS